jgi:microcystin-dependent protein
MSTPFMGQIEMFSFNFAPKGWALCNGQLLPINQNQALFSLLGTMYGGDGRVTFGLPNLQSRIPISFGTNTQGAVGGQESHTLTIAEGPAHNHALNANSTTTTGRTGAPGPTVTFAQSQGIPAQGAPFALQMYGTTAPGGNLTPQTIGFTGGSQAHENRMPYLAISFCISLQGIFPSRN